MIDLGTLGGSYSAAAAINDSGQVVGQSETSDGHFHAFLWTDANGMIDLGIAGVHSAAVGINNSGDVVGWRQVGPMPSMSVGFLWTPAEGTVDTGTVTSYAEGINNVGQVVGWNVEYEPPPSCGYQAFRWTAAKGKVDLGALDGCSSFSHYSIAWGINAAGQVVGESGNGGGGHAFLWTAATGMIDLGTLGGASSSALGINDAGQVVGYSHTADGSTHATLWRPRKDLAAGFGAPYGIELLAGGTWASLHGLSPVAIVRGDLDGNGLDDLVINFGPGVGVYAWMNRATWMFLHPFSPSQMVTGDLDHNGHDDVVAVFPGYGVWRWSDGDWSNLHWFDATHLAVGQLDGVAGADLIAAFPGEGVWIFANNSTWKQEHPLDAAAIVTADLNADGFDDVVIDFPGFGLWVEFESGIPGLGVYWKPLHPQSATHIAAGRLEGGKGLVIDFGPGIGIWTYIFNYYDPTWKPLIWLTSRDLLLADLNGTGIDEVVIDFGPSNGLWQYTDDSVWSQIHWLSSKAMVGFH